MSAEKFVQDFRINSAVESIVADLTSRSGFDHVWDSLDDETRAEIKQTWAYLIRQEMIPHRKEPKV